MKGPDALLAPRNGVGVYDGSGEALAARVGDAEAEGLLYLGAESDCDVCPWWRWPASVIAWRLTGRRVVTRRDFVALYLSASFDGSNGSVYLSKRFVDLWHRGELRWCNGRRVN